MHDLNSERCVNGQLLSRTQGDPGLLERNKPQSQVQNSSEITLIYEFSEESMLTSQRERIEGRPISQPVLIYRIKKSNLNSNRK